MSIQERKLAEHAPRFDVAQDRIAVHLCGVQLDPHPAFIDQITTVGLVLRPKDHLVGFERNRMKIGNKLRVMFRSKPVPCVHNGAGLVWD